MKRILDVKNITVCYQWHKVIRNLSFTVDEGEILAIVGESGSGKSTAIRAVIGLLGSSGMVHSGDIIYNGKNIPDMQERELRMLRGTEIGMVFQDCRAALCPVRTIGAQIEETFEEHGIKDKAAALGRAGDIMRRIGLEPERIFTKYPFELSGGMNQRIGICMAMMLSPRLMLADEPTSALDVTVQKHIIDELLLMRESYRTSMIVVTHNIGVAKALSDRVLVLKDGEAAEYGSTSEVLEHPQNEYTRLLCESVLRL